MKSTKKASKTIFVVTAFIAVVTVVLVYVIQKYDNNTYPEDFNKQWALYNTGQIIEGIKGKRGVDINVKKAWKITKGEKEIIVGLLDTGIQYDNVFIKASVFENTLEIPNNGIDEDENGYIDDVHGWNFFADSNVIYNNYLHDFHGTQLASIIASSHENGNIIGVSPNITLLPLKFMQGTKGNINSAINAISYGVEMGVRIINCSWDNLEYNQNLEKIIRKNNDVIFVCSAGKSSTTFENSPVYPAAFDLPNVISVAAVDNKALLCANSGFGSLVDVAAPGGNVLVSLPDGDADYVSGTSIATAYVTGTIALMLSVNPNLTPEEIIEITKSTSKPLKTLKGKVASNGIIDAYACVMAARKSKK